MTRKRSVGRPEPVAFSDIRGSLQVVVSARVSCAGDRMKHDSAGARSVERTLDPWASLAVASAASTFHAGQLTSETLRASFFAVRRRQGSLSLRARISSR